MKKRLAVLSEPCLDCPYRLSTPIGIWDASEYEKLRLYGQGNSILPAVGIFLCHHAPILGEETVCRGWLTVEAESIAVRMALCRGIVTGKQVYAAVRAPLYATGEEAAAARLSGVEKPPLEAKKAVRRLLRSRRKARR